MRIGEVANQKGISSQTLRLWEKEGLISPSRTTLGHRIFSREDLLKIEKVIRERSQERKRS